MSANLVHWDDVRGRDRVHQDIAARWFDLGSAAGSRGIGVQRIVVHPGKRTTPVHVHGAEEEIFWILSGSGLLWQDGETSEVGPGDCIVHLPGRVTHTLRAGGQKLFSAHQMGTCRMGPDPQTSVANPWGELHDTKGVWIGDGSAFPTASGTNPMITIMALARRTAFAIAAAAGKPAAESLVVSP